jgi:chitinase
VNIQGGRSGDDPAFGGSWSVWAALASATVQARNANPKTAVPCGGSAATPTATSGATATATATATSGATATSTATATPTPTLSSTPTPCPNCKRIVGYFEQWAFYHQNYYVKNVDTSGSASKLSHLNYAFGNIVNNQCSVGVTQTGVGDAYADYEMAVAAAQSVDGVADMSSDALKGHWHQLKKLKAKYPGLKVIMSLGGWTWSDGFYSAAQPANVSAFVSSCINAYIKGNIPVAGGAGGTGVLAGVFDGIDIDWEYPAVCGNNPNCGASSADTANFTGLMAEFRKQLDAAQPGLLLVSGAMPAGNDKFSKIQLGAVAQSVDMMNLMTFDFHGTWESTTNFLAPLYANATDPTPTYNVDYAVRAYLAAGVPAAKINLGVPFYGRGWTGVADVNNGLYQAGTAAPSSYSPYGQPGYESYANLEAIQGGYRNLWDSSAQAFWIFNGSTFWSYDDPTSMTNKMTYAKNQGLGGAMVWALTHDTSTGTLISAVSSGLQ